MVKFMDLHSSFFRMTEEQLWEAPEADVAVELCERGYAASREVSCAAYLFPFLLPVVRARLARAEVEDAAGWVDRVEEALRARAIPGILPAAGYARNLTDFAAGDVDAGREDLARADADWHRAHRVWLDDWARLDLVHRSVWSRRRGEAAALAGRVRSAAVDAGAAPVVSAADELLEASRDRRGGDPWAQLTAREYALAGLVVAGLTDRQIASRLTPAEPTAVRQHVEETATA
jgi:ATP/maltotriose-dependent transcriptional regulator MalT